MTVDSHNFNREMDLVEDDDDSSFENDAMQRHAGLSPALWSSPQSKSEAQSFAKQYSLKSLGTLKFSELGDDATIGKQVDLGESRREKPAAHCEDDSGADSEDNGKRHIETLDSSSSSSAVRFSIETAVQSSIVKRRTVSDDGLFEWVQFRMTLVKQDNNAAALCFISDVHTNDDLMSTTSSSLRREFSKPQVSTDVVWLHGGDKVTQSDKPLRFSVTTFSQPKTSNELTQRLEEESFLCTTNQECTTWVRNISHVLEFLNDHKKVPTHHEEEESGLHNFATTLGVFNNRNTEHTRADEEMSSVDPFYMSSTAGTRSGEMSDFKATRANSTSITNWHHDSHQASSIAAATLNEQTMFDEPTTSNVLDQTSVLSSHSYPKESHSQTDDQETNYSNLSQSHQISQTDEVKNVRPMKLKRKPPVPRQQRNSKNLLTTSLPETRKTTVSTKNLIQHEGRHNKSIKNQKEAVLEVTIPSKVKPARKPISRNTKLSKSKESIDTMPKSPKTLRSRNGKPTKVVERTKKVDGRDQIRTADMKHKALSPTGIKGSPRLVKRKSQRSQDPSVRKLNDNVKAKKSSKNTKKPDVLVMTESYLEDPLMVSLDQEKLAASRNAKVVAKLHSMYKEQVETLENLLLEEGKKLSSLRDEAQQILLEQKNTDVRLREVTTALEKSTMREQQCTKKLIEAEDQITRLRDSNRVDEAGAIGMVSTLESKCNQLQEQVVEALTAKQTLQLQVDKLANECALLQTKNSLLLQERDQIACERDELQRVVYGSSKVNRREVKSTTTTQSKRDIDTRVKSKKKLWKSRVKSSGYGQQNVPLKSRILSRR